ncbi:MAG: Spermidine/putrescine import ATP-binding protein PotA [Firmicutes bacterium]|nr:Spermidine/putrescine import ATP-binding protein PotA [candidate division NPL-UPA2 bacterium]
MAEEICAAVRTTSQSHVELSSLCKLYPDVKALYDLTLTVNRGEFFSLLGPSGCGKTTTLRLIAGLDCLSEGSIAIDGTLVSSPTYFMPPEKRGVGIVFQDYALFPHMTVFENVAFGLYGSPKAAVAKRVSELLGLVGLAAAAQKYPHEMSGGQKQRVALARALAPAPRVMLLDEPFSNLDAELRAALRSETKEILRDSGTTVILVTHDQEEAFSLSDRVGLLNCGKLEQVGTPYEIYHHPATRFVADFVGRADYLAARVEGSTVVSGLGRFALPSTERQGSADVDLLIRPDDVSIADDPSGTAVITEVRFLGAHALYTLQLDNGSVLHSQGLSAHLLPPYTRVAVTVNMRHTVVFAKQA